MASKNLSSIEILEKLISFPTISKTPNIELINLTPPLGLEAAEKVALVVRGAVKAYWHMSNQR